MNAADSLLIFIGRDGAAASWLRLSDGAIADRGDGLEDAPALIGPDDAEPLMVVAVVPGETVALHWLELPAGLSPPQAAAAARLLATELSTQLAEQLHVAVGPEIEGTDLRCVAMVPAADMVPWIAALQSAALDPDSIIPEQLLLLPRDGAVMRYDGRALPLFRGATDAFAVEPELAEVVLRDAPVETLSDESFEAELAAAIADRPVDLRQGLFAKRRRWKIDWRLVRRLAMLALAILLVTFAIQIVSIMRYTFAADRLEAEVASVAGEVLPGVRISNPSRQLGQRLTELQGSGVGYSMMASTVFAAVQATPGLEVVAIQYDGQGTLRLTVRADAPAAISALQQQLDSSGSLVADVGALRTENGRQSAEISVRAR
ncbi:MAG: type II secretion system protein GspL [Pseudomonadota bacterium]|nr:type II secretion system protein GspL [Pseudomonadota bacterium]